ncbi:MULTISPECIES: hypothetical protein [Aerosakkonema]|uniref:hypothetical protein n=1 Tax=Aerosakkonema TaxID=1246629 RepID=UPI0035B6FCDD
MTKRDILLSILASLIKKSTKDEELLAHSVTKNLYSKVLPPFGGEMGFEIRSFLGRVEPWLRNGWKIIAKRPEFYPKDTAIYDREYLQKESEIIKKYNAVRVSNSYYIRQSDVK